MSYPSSDSFGVGLMVRCNVSGIKLCSRGGLSKDRFNMLGVGIYDK